MSKYQSSKQMAPKETVTAGGSHIKSALSSNYASAVKTKELFSNITASEVEANVTSKLTKVLKHSSVITDDKFMTNCKP